MAASRRGLTNHNPFILIKEQFWKWGHSLGSAELEKRCSGSPLQLQGCFYPKISLCAQPDTDTRVPVSLGYSWDCAGPAKQHPEHDSGQAHRDRHWAGEGWGGAKYRSNERNRVCMGVQGSSTEWWTVQEQSQSWVCRGKGRHVHTVSHSPFFPVRLQEQQSHYCTKHRQKHGPLCRISHARSQWAPPCTSCFADSGQQLVASSLRLQHG